MISSAHSTICEWSNLWTPIQVKENHYYLEHQSLKSIVSTRLYCSREQNSNNNFEWPYISIHLSRTTYKCHIKFIEEAFDIVLDAAKKNMANDSRFLGMLVDKKVEFITNELHKLNRFCTMTKILIENELLVSTIKTIEKCRRVAASSHVHSNNSIYPLAGPLPLIVLANGHVVIEFPIIVEKATAKIIHEAYGYDDSKQLVCLRPKNPKFWKKEIKVYKKLLSEGLLTNPDSGFLQTLNIDEKMAVQIRCKGDLLSRIDSIDNQKKLEAAAKIAKAINYLHKLDITHGDLKLENVLYDDNGVYLIDFGFACFGKWKRVHGYFGTYGMTAPELIRDAYVFEQTGKIGEVRDFTKFDSFSFGVMLWCMRYKERGPFEKEDEPFDMDRYESNITKMEKLPKPSSGTIGHVMRGLMKLNPQKRWTIQKAQEKLNKILISKVSKRGFDECNFLPPPKN